MKKIFTALLLGCFCLPLLAAPHVGDTVKVSCMNPLIVLGKAKVTAVSSNTITVSSHLDTYTFELTNIVVEASVTSSMVASTAPSFPTVASQSNPASQVSQLDPGMEILSKFQGDPNYSKAVGQYQGNMAKIMNGQMDVHQLRDLAANALAQADAYGPERAKDPQYEPYIAQLKDFVKRADAGEQFNFPTGNQVQ